MNVIQRARYLQRIINQTRYYKKEAERANENLTEYREKRTVLLHEIDAIPDQLQKLFYEQYLDEFHQAVETLNSSIAAHHGALAKNEARWMEFHELLDYLIHKWPDAYKKYQEFYA